MALVGENYQTLYGVVDILYENIQVYLAGCFKSKKLRLWRNLVAAPDYSPPLRNGSCVLAGMWSRYRGISQSAQHTTTPPADKWQVWCVHTWAVNEPLQSNGEGHYFILIENAYQRFHN